MKFVLVIIMVILLMFCYNYILSVMGDNIVDVSFNKSWGLLNSSNIYFISKVTKYLSLFDIQPIAIDETLLGYTRRSKIIEWCHTISFLISKDDSIVIMKNKIDNIKIIDQGDRLVLENIENSDVSIILFIYSIDGCNLVYSDKKIKKDKIFPLKSNKFDNIVINIPSDSHDVLDFIYDYDWRNICVYNDGVKEYKTKCSQIYNKPDVYDILNNAWVINLESRPDRYENSVKELSKVGIDATRWNAVNAKSKEFQDYYENLEGFKQITKISISAAACFRSHYNLWKFAYERGDEYAMIFEDDIIVNKGVTQLEIVNTIKNSLGFNVLFMGHCHTFYSLFNNNKQLAVQGTGLCLHGYVISRHAMGELLKIECCKSPIDTLVKYYCEKNICYLANNKSTIKNTYGEGLILQNMDFGSDISIVRSFKT
jgi:hypothetical protein